MPTDIKNILLAEDEPQIRKMIATILRGKGYNVLEAVDGKDAIHIANEHSQDHIDLLLTDVVMPYITGPELANQFKSMFPKANIILMSGYTEETILKKIKSDQKIHFIAKPFLPQVLTEIIDQLLNPHSQIDQSGATELGSTHPSANIH